jgi:hypothetical protein
MQTSDLFSGQGSVSPVKKPSRRSQKPTASRVNDVKFATDISESLLVECRRLQALIAERDRKLEEEEIENEELRHKSAALDSKLHKIAESEGMTGTLNFFFWWHVEKLM